MVSVGGNYYSVPDTTRRRVLEVHALADEIRIYEAGQLVAAIPCSKAATSAASRPVIARRLHRPPDGMLPTNGS